MGERDEPDSGNGRAHGWSFGSARFDERSLKLFVHDAPAELELKPLEVLRYLLRHPGEAVSKEELIKAVWPGRIISDSALTSTIAKLREALGDQQDVLRTVHGFGYRLEAAVRSLEPEPGAKVPGLIWRLWEAPGRRRGVAAVAAACLLAGAGLAFRSLGPAPPGMAEKSVAVLPFANLSAAPGSAYFADGIHDTVITHLARVQGLKTISRTSVLEFRDDAKRNLRKIGAALDVAHVVEGSVQRDGQRVRVTAQLIHVASGRLVWGESYDRDVADLFAIQSDIAQRVAGAVHATLSADEVSRIARRPTEDAEAYDLYLRALAVWRSPHVVTEQDLDDVIAVLDQATRRDPGFALAYALLAHFHVARHWYLRHPESGELAARASERSLALQPDLVEGLLARGHYVDWVLQDKDAAIELYERARRLAPGNAQVLGMLAGALVNHGRLEDAVRAHEQATLLAPLDAEVVQEYADTLAALRRYAESERAYDRAAKLGVAPWIAPLQKAYAAFLRTGDTRLLAAFGSVGPDDRFNMYFNTRRYFTALLLRDFPRAADISLENQAQDTFVTFGGQPLSKHVFAAMAHMFGGDSARAAPHAARALGILEPQLESAPGLVYTRLFVAYALLARGERQRAVAEGRRAYAEWQQAAPTPVAFYGLGSCFFAYVGDEAAALLLLERGLDVVRGINVREVEHLPCYDPLRGNARFRRIVAEHQPADA